VFDYIHFPVLTHKHTHNGDDTLPNFTTKMSMLLFADDQVIIADTVDKLQKAVHKLTLILLTCRIWWAPNFASKWQMGL